MNQEQLTVSYDQFFLKPAKERIKIFNNISAENRAFLVKTQAERWLAVNCSRLNQEQISVVEEVINSIVPDWYQTERNLEMIERKAETLVKKLESILSREDVLQLATNRADYISVIKSDNA